MEVPDWMQVEFFAREETTVFAYLMFSGIVGPFALRIGLNGPGPLELTAPWMVAATIGAGVVVYGVQVVLNAVIGVTRADVVDDVDDLSAGMRWLSILLAGVFGAVLFLPFAYVVHLVERSGSLLVTRWPVALYAVGAFIYGVLLAHVLTCRCQRWLGDKDGDGESGDGGSAGSSSGSTGV